MTPFSPRERLAIYRRAALSLAIRDGANPFPGLCAALQRAQIETHGFTFVVLSDFPEVYAYKPLRRTQGVFWFKPNDTSIRIAILLCAIEDIKLKL